jgi:hypothetical protein
LWVFLFDGEVKTNLSKIKNTACSAADGILSLKQTILA